MRRIVGGFLLGDAGAEVDGVHDVVRGAGFVEVTGDQADLLDRHHAELAVAVTLQPLDDVGRRLTAAAAEAAEREVRPVVTRLGLEAEFGEAFFESGDEFHQRFSTCRDAGPDDSRPILVREASGTGKLEFERFDTTAGVADLFADLGDFAVDHVAEELERQVQMVFGDPFDAVVLFAEISHQLPRRLLNRGAERDRDERPDGMHGVDSMTKRDSVGAKSARRGGFGVGAQDRHVPLCYRAVVGRVGRGRRYDRARGMGPVFFLSLDNPAA